MNGIIGLISFSALLLSVSGQLSNLSPSFSLRGTLARSDNGVPTLTSIYSLYANQYRPLQLTDEIVTTTEGDTSSIFRLSSEYDNATYLRVNSECRQTPFDPVAYFPFTRNYTDNLWDLYAAGTESPPGTYTYTQDGVAHQVTVDGTPTAFIFSFGNTEIHITVSNFENEILNHKIFCLPIECSRFSCFGCTGAAASASISILLLLTALLMYLLTTL